jgi:hypothetical protein
MKHNKEPFIPSDYKEGRDYATEKLQATAEGVAPTEGTRSSTTRNK